MNVRGDFLGPPHDTTTRKTRYNLNKVNEGESFSFHFIQTSCCFVNQSYITVVTTSLFLSILSSFLSFFFFLSFFLSVCLCFFLSLSRYVTCYSNMPL